MTGIDADEDAAWFHNTAHDVYRLSGHVIREVVEHAEGERRSNVPSAAASSVVISAQMNLPRWP
jgi:hypothetical protein